MFRWPLPRRGRLRAVPPPDVVAEVLARLDRIEQRLGEHDRTLNMTYSAIEYALKAKGVPLPGEADTQPLPIPLHSVRNRRASAG
jgi:hypothetical protein